MLIWTWTCEIVFEKNGTQLIILSTDVNAKSSKTKEFVKDLLSIVTIFVTRHNEMHSAINHRRRQETAKAQEEKEWQDFTRQDMIYSFLFYVKKKLKLKR